MAEEIIEAGAQEEEKPKPRRRTRKVAVEQLSLDGVEGSGEDQGSEEKKPAKPRTLSVLDDKKSLQVDASLGTETLAVILEQQGKFDKALAIYKNLLARNPEKSSIFAPRIEKLEQQINSK